jgi:hypothetical protein
MGIFRIIVFLLPGLLLPIVILFIISRTIIAMVKGKKFLPHILFIIILIFIFFLTLIPGIVFLNLMRGQVPLY